MTKKMTGKWKEEVGSACFLIEHFFAFDQMETPQLKNFDKFFHKFVIETQLVSLFTFSMLFANDKNNLFSLLSPANTFSLK